MKPNSIKIPLVGFALLMSFYGCSKKEEQAVEQAAAQAETAEQIAAREYEADLKANGVIIPNTKPQTEENVDVTYDSSEFPFLCSSSGLQDYGTLTYVSTVTPLQTYIMEYSDDLDRTQPIGACPVGTKLKMTKAQIDELRALFQNEQKYNKALKEVALRFQNAKPVDGLKVKSIPEMKTLAVFSSSLKTKEILGEPVLIAKKCTVSPGGQLKFLGKVPHDIENWEILRQTKEGNFGPYDDIGVFQLDYDMSVRWDEAKMKKNAVDYCLPGAIVLRQAPVTEAFTD